MHRSDETHTLEQQPSASPIGAIIRVRGTALELRLGSGSCVVGAGSEADLVIDDKAVSRRHLELRLVPEGVQVKDLGSRNGSFYLGQRVGEMVLSFGSVVRLGETEVAIDPDLDSLPAHLGPEGYRGLYAASPAMRKLFATLHRLEGSLVNVLVEGESGVGKELIARALHEGSRASGGPLVVVNCGAIGRELVLSELFGHKKGAFTGATEARVGAFEAADGGTLFLDEVGELPLDAQPVLLRALELGEVKPVGENRPKHVRVRVIAATNRDLREEVEAGNFREDLYYRLAVVRLAVPPLRERSEDVRILAQHFAAAAGGGTLPDDVVAALEKRTFRGNARELRNAVLAYLALGTLPDAPIASPDLLLQALRQAVDAGAPYQDEKERFIALFSKAYFELLLEKSGGNHGEAARVAGIDRSYFSKLLAKYGVGR